MDTNVRHDLAPTGTLRAAINLGNPVLAQKDAAGGDPRGVSVALARALAERLRVPIALVTFDAAGKVVDAMDGGGLDIAFLAIDPIRAAGLAFTDPYVLIEGTYAVRRGGTLRTIADVDRPGVRVAVARGSAYDLFLTRALRCATLVRESNGPQAMAMFVGDGLEVLAGVRQPLDAFAREHPDLEVMPERFMAIEQAMAIPRARAGPLPFLRTFLDEARRGGLIERALADSGQDPRIAAPPKPA